jgi:hypothetical protein
MAMGQLEDVRLIPVQATRIAVTSHDRDGIRVIPLIPSKSSYNSPIFQVLGYADLEVFVRADKEGMLRIWFANYPQALSPVGALLPDSEDAAAHYEPGALLPPHGRVFTYRAAVRAGYAAVRYSNLDAIDALQVFDFSILLKPVGRS